MLARRGIKIPERGGNTLDCEGEADVLGVKGDEVFFYSYSLAVIEWL